MERIAERLRRSRSHRSEARSIDDLYRSLLLHVDPEPLYASVLARMGEIASSERCALFLVDARDGALRAHSQTGSWPQELLESAWGTDAGLARWLGINERGLRVAAGPEVVADLPAPESRLLRESGVEVVVPLEAGNRLTGFLLFGSTAQAGGWSGDLVSFLTTLAVPASLAFEHSALVREEKQRLRRLYRAERLATAGTVAAGLAHEIRNPMTAIRSGIQMLRSEAGLSQQGREVLDDAIHKVDRIDRLVGGLVEFARSPRARVADFDLTEAARRASALLAGKYRERGVRLGLELSEAPVLVRGDAGQLEQVLLNLLLNALDAVEDGGEVRVGLTRLPGERTGRVRVEVHDDGPGVAADVAADVRDRILDPFFTTKPEGSGLGLPISYNIVRHHGGDLTLEDHPDGGAVARFVLPEVSA